MAREIAPFQYHVTGLRPTVDTEPRRRGLSPFAKFVICLVGIPFALVLTSIAASVPYLFHGMMEANDPLREAAVASAQTRSTASLNSGFGWGLGLGAAGVLLVAILIKGQ